MIVAPSASTYAPTTSALSGTTTSSDPSTSLHPSTAANTPTSTILRSNGPSIVDASAAKCSICVLKDRLSESLQSRKRTIQGNDSKLALIMTAKRLKSQAIHVLMLKVLNQNLKRMDDEIKILKGERKLENAYMLLENAKRKLKRLQHRSRESAEIHELEAKSRSQDDVIKNLRNVNMLLKEKKQRIESAGKSKNVKPGKTWSPDTVRLMVCDVIRSEMPIRNIPGFISRFAIRSDVHIDCVPHWRTVEKMARELGVITDRQTANDGTRTWCHH